MKGIGAKLRQVLLRAALGWLAIASTAWPQSLCFDSEGRVVESRYDASHSIAYRYDTVGNLTNLVVSGTQGETDGDGDSMPDAWEWVWFYGLTNTAAGDFNGDTVSNLEHYQDQTDPTDPDSDGDGMPNADELLAGTSPTNAASCLRIEVLVTTNASGAVIGWQSVAGKRYRMQRATNLTAGGFSNLKTNITASPVMNVYTDTTASGVGPYHYRIELE